MVVLGATGCLRASVVDRSLPATSKHEEWSATFFWGLSGDPEFDVRRYCGAAPARVRVGGDPIAAGLTFITLGIYVPRVGVISCGASPGPAPRLVGRFGAGKADSE